jgi:hypothetical protein
MWKFIDNTYYTLGKYQWHVVFSANGNKGNGVTTILPAAGVFLDSAHFVQLNDDPSQMAANPTFNQAVTIA